MTKLPCIIEPINGGQTYQVTTGETTGFKVLAECYDKTDAEFIAKAYDNRENLLSTLDFIAGHARMAASNYGPDKEASIKNRNGSFEEIERRALRAIAEARGAA